MQEHIQDQPRQFKICVFGLGFGEFDVNRSVHQLMACESIFVDDLNITKEFPAHTSDNEILWVMREVKDRVHSWGVANRVVNFLYEMGCCKLWFREKGHKTNLVVHSDRRGLA